MSNLFVNDVTEEEEQLYDRQIRLWGLEAQNRLKRSQILIIGVNGISCEVIKNLVLTGINKISLCDILNVTDIDQQNNYLIDIDSVNKNRAYSCFKRTQDLNNRVIVECHSELPKELDPTQETFSILDFDIVIMSNSYIDSWENVNKICKDLGKSFIAMDSFGWHAFAFIDLGHHKYIKEELKSGIENGDDETETKMISEEMNFPQFNEVLKIDWSNTELQKKLKRIPKLQFLLLAVQKFVKLNKRYLTLSDEEGVMKCWYHLAENCGLPSDLITDTDIRECIGAGHVPVNAVIGGLVTQEIIKAVTKKNQPVGNFVLFNGISCSGDTTFLKS